MAERMLLPMTGTETHTISSNTRCFLDQRMQSDGPEVCSGLQMGLKFYSACPTKKLNPLAVCKAGSHSHWDSLGTESFGSTGLALTL